MISHDVDVLKVIKSHLSNLWIFRINQTNSAHISFSKWNLLLHIFHLWPGCDPEGAGSSAVPPCCLRDRRTRRRSSSQPAPPPAVAHSCGSPPCWPSSPACFPGHRWGPSGRSPPLLACPGLAGPGTGWGWPPPSPPLLAALPLPFLLGPLWRKS